MDPALRTPVPSAPGRRYALLVLLATALLGLLGAAVASAYVVVLKDGTQIVTEKAPERRGDRVILTMTSGVQTSYRADDVDFQKTEELNQGKGNLTARVLNGNVQEIQPTAQAETEGETSLSDIAGGRSLGFPEARKRQETVASGRELPKTQAGFVDLMRVERAPLADAQVTQEIVDYLEGQGHHDVRVYEGVSPGQPLLEIRANNENEVFKGIRDAASGLVQIAPRFPAAVQAFDLLLVSDRNIRGGQFSMSVEQAQILVSGRMEPQVYFLRYVEY